MPTALVLQHIDVEGPGLLGAVLQAHGIALRTIRTFAGETVPVRCDAEALIVMGGPMGVYERDRYPHLGDELRLIESALAAGRPIFGTCLGSQLLASALGARVYPNTRKEIGWHEVALTEAAGADAVLREAPRRFTPVHWHGDVFDLPAGAVNLAASALTPHQAFRYGDNAYGLLFHLELDRPHLDSWMRAFAPELEAERIAAETIIGDADRRLARSAAVGRRVFERFAALIA
jgi:GMP synthase (glutamine-hydrolysing)